MTFIFSNGHKSSSFRFLSMVDGTTANEVESETVHVIHSVPKLQDSTDEVPTHGTDIELIPTLGHSPKVNPEDNFNLTMVVSDENLHTGKPVLDSSDDDDEKVCTNTGKKQPSIIHPSGKTLHNKVTGKMAQKGLMRILSRKDGKGTVSDDKENEKIKLTKVLEFVPARKPEQTKIGEVIRYMHNPGNGLSAYWIQG